MIKKATIEEVRRVAIYLKQFEKCTKFVKVDIDYTAHRYEYFIQNGSGVILMLFDDNNNLCGGLGAIKAPDLHDGVMTAVETFWYVDPSYGGGLSLLKAYEQWAKDEKCGRVAMIHLSDSYPDSLETLYKRHKYTLLEKHYIKEI